MIIKEGSKITLIKDNGLLTQDDDNFDFNIHMLNKIDCFTLNQDIDIDTRENEFSIIIGSKNFVCSKFEESIIKGSYIMHGHFSMTGDEIIALLSLIIIGSIFIAMGLSIAFKGTITIPNLF